MAIAEVRAFDTLPCCTIADAVANHAKSRPSHAALILNHRRVTWSELDANATRVARGLVASGVKPGDRVSILLPSSIEFVEILLGIQRAGGVIVPLSTLVTGEGLARMIDDSDSVMVFAGTGFEKLLDPFCGQLHQVLSKGFIGVGFETAEWIGYQGWRDCQSTSSLRTKVDLQAPCIIMYSSGTTGTPKGIVHTHYSRNQFAAFTSALFRFTTDATAIVSTPLYSNGTWLTFLPAITNGVPLVLMPKFSPEEFLDLVEHERCTHTFLVPTQFQAILASPTLANRDVRSLRSMVSAGAPLREETKTAVMQRFGPVLFELYGLTEGVGTSISPEEMPAKLGSVGRALFGSEIRIIDEQGKELPSGQAGEIVGYGTGLMRGYHNRPEQTAEAIWLDDHGRTHLRTGDIGKLDEDGFLYILDRKKDMILSGGFNVFPSDIEAVLARHPAIADVTVIGMPDEKWGERAVAVVTPKPGQTPGSADIIEWSNPQLAKHQRLAAVHFRESFPRNALGKVLKRELRATLS